MNKVDPLIPAIIAADEIITGADEANKPIVTKMPGTPIPLTPLAIPNPTFHHLLIRAL